MHHGCVLGGSAVDAAGRSCALLLLLLVRSAFFAFGITEGEEKKPFLAYFLNSLGKDSKREVLVEAPEKRCKPQSLTLAVGQDKQASR